MMDWMGGEGVGEDGSAIERRIKHGSQATHIPWQKMLVYLDGGRRRQLTSEMNTYLKP